jgi:D-glycero-alpha-D-manno-heptose-7-phosphate kinase
MLLISKCPLRISLVGGGTDVPRVSEKLKEGGRTVGFSANWQMTLVGHSFYQGLRLKYSEVEDVTQVSNIRHDIAREVITRLSPGLEMFEIASLCDVIGGTGLGSSSAFTVALINLLSSLKGEAISIEDLAYAASIAEIDWCGRPIGLQDHFLCAAGGMNAFSFSGKNRPTGQSLPYDPAWSCLESSPMILVRVGGIHDSGAQLADAGKRVSAYKDIRALVDPAVEAIQRGDIIQLASLVLESWKFKKAALPAKCNKAVDEIIEEARFVDPRAGGKLLGSGGGGFVLILSESSGALLERFGARAQKIMVNPASADVIAI